MEGIKEQTVEEYINTNKCLHILLSHHFIQTMRHSNMFQPPPPLGFYHAGVTYSLNKVVTE